MPYHQNLAEADSIKEIVEKPYFSNRIGTTAMTIFNYVDVAGKGVLVFPHR